MRTRPALACALAAAALGCGRAPSAAGDGEWATAHDSLAPHADGWCEVCKAGYVAAIKVPSRELFEVLDAHGHDVDPDAMSCETCRAAWKTGAFCRESRMGFVGGKAYLSRLTYQVARAGVEDPARIACADCRANTRGHGWCDRCGQGRVGVLRVGSREDLEELWKAVEKLRRALRCLDRCETCAIAAFTDGGCRRCALSYRDGEPLRNAGRPSPPAR